MKHVLITLHGIRTRGVWQKNLTTHFTRQKNRWIIYPLDYGYFPVWGLLWPPYINKLVKWFIFEYEKICTIEDVNRPSIIAHSLGTIILARAIEKYSNIRFDKIILCGSIVSRKFNWTNSLENEQVMFLHNDYSTSDIWPRISSLIFYSNTGISGSKGFINEHSRLVNNKNNFFKHSDYFSNLHVNNHWMPGLSRYIPTREQVQGVHALMQIVLSEISKKMKIEVQHLRASIFLMDNSGYLKMVPEFAFNINNEIEKSIKFYPKFGCVGQAWEKNEVIVSIKKKSNWPQPITDEEYNKIDPALKWVVSIPLPVTNNNMKRGVISYDGLHFEPDKTKLQALYKTLLLSAEHISNQLN